MVGIFHGSHNCKLLRCSIFLTEKYTFTIFFFHLNYQSFLYISLSSTQHIQSSNPRYATSRLRGRSPTECSERMLICKHDAFSHITFSHCSLLINILQVIHQSRHYRIPDSLCRRIWNKCCNGRIYRPAFHTEAPGIV